MKKNIVVLMMAAALLGCGKKEEVVEAPVLRPVKYVVIEKTASDIAREFSGTIKAETESRLSFRVPGTIERKFVSLGEEVRRGEVLAEVDRIDYEVKYQASIADLEKTKASLVRAQADFERYQKLYFNDNVSKAEYDSALAQFKSSKAQVEAAEKQVEYDRLQLSYTKLVSPANGTIAEELSEENETISAGTPVFMLSLEGDLEVEFFVPESLIGQIRAGEEIVVAADAAQREEIRGEITKVGTVSTGFGRTFPVKAKLIDPSEAIKSGMTAQVKLNFKFADEDVIILPLQSVVTDSVGNTYVYKLEGVSGNEGTVKKVDVKTGKVTNRGIEVTEGLESGELVITAGMSKITEGQKVEVPPKGVR
jgi:RND family efflux transporter MFP subunit